MSATVTLTRHSGSTTNRRFSSGSNGNVTRMNSEAMNPILPHNDIESASWPASQNRCIRISRQDFDVDGMKLSLSDILEPMSVRSF
jgi:hypothetical protein